MMIVALSFVICHLSLCRAVAQNPVTEYGQLQVKGTQLCDYQGRPVTLRGVSLSWHNWWPRFYNKKIMKTLKRDWHCSVVRAAMGVQPEEDPKGGYNQNPGWAVSCLTPIIETAIKQNVYVIIDWHSHHMYTREAKQFFGEMAQKYGHYPHIIYEIFNEPIEDTWTDMKKYATEVISEIRKYDPDNIVLIGSPHWDQDIHLVANSPLEGFQNIMYTVHFYAATHGEDLRQRTEEAVKSGIPVFISECGFMEASGDGPVDMESTEQWIQLCERLGLSWVCWSISDKGETCSMLLPQAKSAGPWSDSVIKPYGQQVKGLLRHYNASLFTKH